jgi:DHA1 family bicyclomycin/chloramphenicol resistance-like MFS transporter
MRTQPTRQSSTNLVALALCMALQMTGFVMILPLFARRFESFGAGVRAFSLSSLAYALTGMISAPIMGMLADRFGRRPIILFSLAAYVSLSAATCSPPSCCSSLLRGSAGIFTAGLVPP